MPHTRHITTKLRHQIFIWVWLVCAACAQAAAQAADTLVVAAPNIQNFWVDALDNLYIINAQNELIKHSKNNAQIFNFRNAVWGKPSIDVSNPTEILIFYPEASLMAVLDQRLNVLSNVKLYDIFDNEAAVICRSFDNNFWLYHETAFRLKKINGNAQVIIDGERIPMIIKNHKPLKIVEHQSKIFVLFDGLGILIFDIFGNYIKKIDVPPITNFSIYQNELFYIDNEKLYIYYLNSGSIKPSAITLPAGSKLYVRTDRGGRVLTNLGVVPWAN